ncbi:Transcriptional regulator [Hahella chejuensis KCTC 2396]|uniref:Transcriptional regulator n=2 Tax=Hahella chejuensis TaxID=158327 RepID=Q2SB74_HAHCH|nr:Transcriptional regulator [Hahella chejuensis KCTC 2396]
MSIAIRKTEPYSSVFAFYSDMTDKHKGNLTTTMALNPQRTEQILEAAKNVFHQSGYARASMDRVAKEAGVSKATLYNHFKSKTVLFQAVVSSASARFIQELSDLQTDERRLEPALRIIAERFLTFLLCPHNLAAIRMILAEIQADPELGEAFYQSGPAVAESAIGSFLDKRMRKGEIPQTDPVRAGRHFMALLRGDLFWRALLGVALPQDEINAHLDSVVKQFMQGVAGMAANHGNADIRNNPASGS